jgi:non-canonical (house-cleaning) NTP pyrophosphatase
MKVVIASQNPAKIRAVKAAFMLQFPEEEPELIPLSVESGVNEQPMSDKETRRGARNRARNALTAFAWMAILGPDQRIGEARTVTLPLPPAVKALVEEGLELGDANDRVFSTVNSKHQGGAFGLLTRGIHTREGVYTEALVIALVPFVNELY